MHSKFIHTTHHDIVNWTASFRSRQRIKKYTFAPFTNQKLGVTVTTEGSEN